LGPCGGWNKPDYEKVLQGWLLIWNAFEEASKWVGEEEGGYELD